MPTPFSIFKIFGFKLICFLLSDPEVESLSVLIEPGRPQIGRDNQPSQSRCVRFLRDASMWTIPCKLLPHCGDQTVSTCYVKGKGIRGWTGRKRDKEVKVKRYLTDRRQDWKGKKRVTRTDMEGHIQGDGGNNEEERHSRSTLWRTEERKRQEKKLDQMEAENKFINEQVNKRRIGKYQWKTPTKISNKKAMDSLVQINYSFPKISCS